MLKKNTNNTTTELCVFTFRLLIYLFMYLFTIRLFTITLVHSFGHNDGFGMENDDIRFSLINKQTRVRVTSNKSLYYSVSERIF